MGKIGILCMHGNVQINEQQASISVYQEKSIDLHRFDVNKNIFWGNDGKTDFRKKKRFGICW